MKPTDQELPMFMKKKPCCDMCGREPEEDEIKKDGIFWKTYQGDRIKVYLGTTHNYTGEGLVSWGYCICAECFEEIEGFIKSRRNR